MQPSEEPLDLPAPLVTPELALVLGLFLLPVLAVWGDHIDAFLGEHFVEWIGAVGSVPDQPLGLLVQEARLERRLYERESIGNLHADGAREARGAGTRGASSALQDVTAKGGCAR